MRNVIFNKNGKLVLGDYEWFRNSECFVVGYGTTSRREKHYQDLRYKVVAHINYSRKNVGRTFFSHYEYPKENTLKVLLNEPIEITEDQIRKMRGFKKYFGHCNIKNIKIEYAEGT